MNNVILQTLRLILDKLDALQPKSDNTTMDRMTALEQSLFTSNNENEILRRTITATNNYTDYLQKEHEQLKQALQKCSPKVIDFTDYDGIIHYECRFCGSTSTIDEHESDCEYVKLCKT